MSTRPLALVSLCAVLAVLLGVAAVGGCASIGRGEDGATGDGDAGPAFGNDEGGAGTVSQGGGTQPPPDVDGGTCMPDATPGPGPVQRLCVHFGSDDNECDGHHDLQGFPANGADGNGFDDNCNGLVDEGCTCTAPGSTKDCYLVPASQTVAGVPAGWCAQNSKGTMDCTGIEFPKWSGNCRGAQPPYSDDICAPGDFDCDGKEQNSKAKDCSKCEPGTVACPTTPLETAPFPDPANLPLKVDAAGWFTSSQDVGQATNWKWTLRGGDCDNILPHVTFGMYTSNVAQGAPLGVESKTLGTSGKEHGRVATAPALTSSFFPAFSLSGDYLVTGEFDLRGQHYACTQKIEVRAPGLRAEACWDTVSAGVDLDLHMAKVSGTYGCTRKGWADTCEDASSTSLNEDCYYGNCTSGGFGGGSGPNWYPPATTNTCIGWGSKASGNCYNPRLDIDTNGGGACGALQPDPNADDTSALGSFCGPENINVDEPGDGDKFAVSLNYFAGSPVSKGHVNIYCNGARVLASGYDPVTGGDFPHLVSAGGDGGNPGDMWKVAMVTTHVQNGTLSCDVATTQSTTPSAQRDGSKAYCVDNNPANGANSTKWMTKTGALPATANDLCFH